MTIAATISFILTSLIINIPFLSDALVGDEGVAKALAKNEGIVLGTVEKIKDLPREAYDFFYSKNNNLPANEDRSFPKKTSDDYIDIDVQAGIVIDKKTGLLLWKKEAGAVRSIASISKLMTALVFLDNNPGWENVYRITRQDRKEGGKIYLYLGEEVKVKDFLVKESFFKKEIREASLSKEYEFITQGGRAGKIYSTDYLLKNFPQNGIHIVGGKTGYTDRAGFCFVGEFVNNNGQGVISVVLGSPSNEERFSQTKNLIGWVYASYLWP